MAGERFSRHMQVPRSDIIEDEHLEYLDRLRSEGVTNMFGSAFNLRQEFPALSRDEACVVVDYWMRTFGRDAR